MKKLTTTLAALAVPVLLAGPMALSSSAADHTELMSTLGELNDSGGSGTVWAKVTGNEVWLSMEVSGLLDGAPHAQHIHIGGTNSCPDPMMEGTGADGAIRTTDAVGSYGGVAVSLTTEGGMTGPDHALDVANFPAMGTYTYERTFEVSDEVAAQIAAGDGVVVVHGTDHNGSGAYDGDQESDLDPSLPSEATDPALCGALDVAPMEAPSGGVQTGGGSTQGMEQGGLIAGGALLAAVGAGSLLVRRRAQD
ncbi:CHRD domain-containing protein [Ornithinimicrobium sp. LYQ121]|uniref:CHRD domain-containing protein n=1 Tax=Ornithinimicrobium sp. LYQ121 TaxID=3378801 RepID=UPI0038534FE1